MTKLTLIDRAFFLKKIPLFAALDLELLLAIAEKLHMMSYEPQDQIFGIMEEANRMYFIVKGYVEIKNGENLTLATLQAEDFFGDESLFSEKPRAYRAVSKTESILLSLTRTHLLTTISECPSVAIGLLQAYTSMTNFRPRAVN